MKEEVRQKFNILCVSRCQDEHVRQWHEPITGVAEVVLCSDEDHGVEITRTVIRFSGQEYDFYEVDVGLTGLCVAIIAMKYPGSKDWIKLYTDVPAEGYTVADVKEQAAWEIEDSAHRR